MGCTCGDVARLETGCGPLIMLLTDLALYGLPFTLTWPSGASSSAILRRLRRSPVTGDWPDRAASPARRLPAAFRHVTCAPR